MKVSLTEIQLLFHLSSLIPHQSSFVIHPAFALLFVALIAALVLTVLLVAVALVVAASSRHKKSSRAPLDLVGRVGIIERDLNPEGAVLVGGELFRARTRTGEKIQGACGARVRVVGARGHLLEVEREE
jgi:membrane-bound serine protease (ClpP class)